MNALAEIKRLPENKQQQETFINAVIGEMLSGNDSALKTDIQLKIVEDTIKKIRSDVRVKNLLHDEINCYGKEDIKINNASVKLKTRRTPDYTPDPVWSALKAKLKARETELKTLGCIPETGEEIIYKYSEFIEIKY